MVAGLALRFFRNIPSLVSFPGQLHTDYDVQGAGGYFSEGSLYHYALVERNEQQRRQKVAQYERISPGNSKPWLYCPTSPWSLPDRARR